MRGTVSLEALLATAEVTPLSADRFLQKKKKRSPRAMNAMKWRNKSYWCLSGVCWSELISFTKTEAMSEALPMAFSWPALLTMKILLHKSKDGKFLHFLWIFCPVYPESSAEFRVKTTHVEETKSYNSVKEDILWCIFLNLQKWRENRNFDSWNGHFHIGSEFEQISFVPSVLRCTQNI